MARTIGARDHGLVDHCETCGRHIGRALLIHSDHAHSSNVILCARSILVLKSFVVDFALLQLPLILGTVLLVFHPPVPPDHVPINQYSIHCIPPTHCFI